MPPEFRVVSICYETHDLLVETVDAFLMVDIEKYTDALGRLILPEAASQAAAFVHFRLYGESWAVPLGSNVSDVTLRRPDHRAGAEKHLARQS